MLCCLRVGAQVDSIAVGDSLQDTTPPLPPVKFHFQEVGVDWIDGSVQFFEGYDARILYADAQSGLPIYPDWGNYSRGVVLPKYYQVGLHAGLVDTVRGIKLRLSAFYSHRQDSMNYGSDYTINDTMFGRIASEKGSFVTLGFAGIKQSRMLFGFLRFHGGAEIELGLSPASRIAFEEYAADIGEDRVIAYNEFKTTGKPRFLLQGSAILGLETVFGKHFGFTLEVKSGLGWQIVIESAAFGMGRTTYHAGLNYYLFDYNRKALPRPVPEEKQEGQPDQPPTPGF